MPGTLPAGPKCVTPNLYSSDSPDRPFCSKRSRMIDLGESSSEGYQIAAEPEFDEFSSDMLEDPGMMQTRH